MDSKNTIQEFMSLMKKDFKSNFQKLNACLVQLSKLHCNESDYNSLAAAILKYIDIVIDLSASKRFREQIKICRKWLDLVQELANNSNIREVFMKRVTHRIFDILIEDDVNSWCVKKEMIKMFLRFIQHAPKELRCNVARELPEMYLFKIVDSISSYGDFDFQVILIETLFRMYGRNAILSKLNDLIPESEELSQSFASINSDTFDEDVRKFLNILNEKSKKVFSIVCKSVILGKIRCGEPMENVDGVWVDFNMSGKAVSWYSTTDSLNRDILDEEDSGWNLVSFFVSDVHVVTVFRPTMWDDVIIYVKLKEPCLLSVEDNSEGMAAADDVKFVVSCESNKANTLITHILPTMFKHKFQNNTTRSSVNKKAVYKPLNVSVHKRSRSVLSRSKSEGSNYASGLDPSSGLSDSKSSRDNSISSASTKCEVISISDDSVHSNESSIDLVPTFKRLSQKTETQNSQYETAEMCHLERLEDARKVSINRCSMKNDSNVFSDSSTLRENSQGVRSEKCSSSKARGSQFSMMTSTPKNGSSNVVESNSYDRYDTALDIAQSLCCEPGTKSEVASERSTSVVNVLEWVSLEDVLDKEVSSFDANHEDNDKRSTSISWKPREEVRVGLRSQKKNQSPLRTTTRNTERSERKVLEELLLGNVPEGKQVEVVTDSQRKGNSNKTKQGGRKENLDSDKIITLFDTEDVIPKDILTHARPEWPLETKGKSRTTQGEESIAVSSQEVLPTLNKSTPRADILANGGETTKTSVNIKEKRNENTEEIVDVLSEEVLPASNKSTPREDILAYSEKSTKTPVETKEKRNIGAKPNEEILCAASQEVLPTTKKSVITKGKRSKNIDAKADEEILNVTNARLPATNTSTWKDDTLTDHKETSKRLVEIKEKRNKYIVAEPNEEIVHCEIVDVSSEEILPASNKSTLREGILAYSGKSTKTPVETKEKRGRNIGAKPNEEILCAASQEVLLATKKSIPKEDILADSAKTTKKSVITKGKRSKNIDAKADEEILNVANAWLPATNTSTGKDDNLTDRKETTKRLVEIKEKRNKYIDAESNEEIVHCVIVDVSSEEILPASNKSTLREGILAYSGKSTKTPGDTKEKRSRNIGAKPNEEILCAASQEVLLATKKSIPKEDILADSAKTTKKSVITKGKRNKDIDAKADEEILNVANAWLPATNTSTGKDDNLTDRKETTKRLVEIKEKRNKYTDAESNEEIVHCVIVDVSSEEILPASNKSTLREGILAYSGKSTKTPGDTKEKRSRNIGAKPNEEILCAASQEVLLATKKSIPKEDILADSTKTTKKSVITKGKRSKDIDAKADEEILNVANAWLPATNTSTGKDDNLTDRKETTKRLVEIKEKRNKYTDAESNEEIVHCVIVDVSSEEILPASNKSTLREGILAYSGKSTKTPGDTKEKRSRNNGAKPNEEILCAASQEVLLATKKSIPKEDILADSTKTTKKSVITKGKRSKDIDAKADEEILNVANAWLPATNTSTGKDDTLTDHKETTKKSVEIKEKRNKNIDAGSNEEIVDVSSQEVLPASNKSTPREEMLADSGKSTKTSVKIKEKQSKNISAKPNEKIICTASQEVLPATKKSTSKENIPADSAKTTKKFVKTKEKLNEDIITIDITSSQETVKILSQEIWPAAKKTKEDILIDDELNRTVELQEKLNDVGTIEIESSQKIPMVPSQEMLAATSEPISMENTINSQAAIEPKLTKRLQVVVNQLILPANKNLSQRNEKNIKKDVTGDIESDEKIQEVSNLDVLPLVNEQRLRDDVEAVEELKAKSSKLEEEIENSSDQSDVIPRKKGRVWKLSSVSSGDDDQDGVYSDSDLFDTIFPEKKRPIPDCERAFAELLKQHNQTTRTFGNQKRRKVYNDVNNLKHSKDTTEVETAKEGPKINVGENRDVPVQKIESTITKSTSKEDVLMDDETILKKNRDVPSQEIAPTIRKSTSRKDVLMDDKIILTENRDVSSQEIESITRKSTSREDILMNDKTILKETRHVPSQEIEPTSIKSSGENVLMNDEIKLTENRDVPSQGIESTTRKSASREDVLMDDETILKETRDVPSQEIKPTTRKSTSREDVLMDYKTILTENRGVPSQGINPTTRKSTSREAILMDDETILRENRDVPSRKIEPTTRKSTSREDVLMDNETILKENLDIPNQEIEPTTLKSTSKENVLMNDKTILTENRDVPSREIEPTTVKSTSKENVLKDDETILKEYREVPSQVIQPTTRKSSLREDVLIEDETISKENQDIPSQEIEPTTVKSTSKENVLMNDKTILTENRDVPSQKIEPTTRKSTSREDVLMDNETILKENRDILNQEIEPTTVKFTSKENVLMNAKTILTENRDVPSREIEPTTVKSISKENVLKDDETILKEYRGVPSQVIQSTTRKYSLREDVLIEDETISKENQDIPSQKIEPTIRKSTFREDVLIDDEKNIERIEKANDQVGNYSESNSSEMIFPKNDKRPIQDCERDFNELLKEHNQTLSNQKKRKMCDDVNDVTHLKNTTVVDTVKAPQEKDIYKKKQTRDRKNKKKDHEKAAKLKVLHSNTSLSIGKYHNSFRSTFCSFLESFRKEVVEDNTIVKQKKRTNKAPKRTEKKVVKKATKKISRKHKYEQMRAHSASDISDNSLKLMGDRKGADAETSLECSPKNLQTRVESSKKINIISNIQLRPKRTLVDDELEVQTKKAKIAENPVSDLNHPVALEQISIDEISNWIETGSPHYSTNASERKTVLKYIHFMSKKSLEYPDETEAYEDMLCISQISKKYV